MTSTCEAVTTTTDRARRPRSLFNPVTDQSTHGVVVDADIIDELKRRLGEKETVEAVATVAAYNMVSRFLVALAI